MSSAEPRKVTLKKWIDDNHRLLTVFGVFGALAAFFAQLNNDVLTGASFLALILLAFEVWTSFPKSEEASIRMQLFESLFFVILILLGASLVGRYWNAIVRFSFLIAFMVSFSVYALIGIELYRKYAIAERVSGFAQRNKKWDVYIRTLAGGIYFALILSLSVLTSLIVAALLH